jgi:hypothetical protein
MARLDGRWEPGTAVVGAEVPDPEVGKRITESGFLSSLAPGRRAAFSKILLAAVAEPDSENLRDFLPFHIVETFVEGECLFTFAATGTVVMGVPVAARHANAATGLFYQCLADERFPFTLAHEKLNPGEIKYGGLFMAWPTTADHRENWKDEALAACMHWDDERVTMLRSVARLNEDGVTGFRGCDAAILKKSVEGG